VRETLENDSTSTKKNDSSDSSSMLMMQSLSNLVQSGSIQIVNDINSRYQDYCKYDNMQVSYCCFKYKKNISYSSIFILQ